MAASNFRGPHFATFPTALVERPLLASCPERVYIRCGAPWVRASATRREATYEAGDLRPGCRCRKGWRRGLVLDPFMGAGTVGLVAEQRGRDWLGIELNPEFAALASERIAAARNTQSTDVRRRRAA
jgi:DNA modification methylase